MLLFLGGSAAKKKSTWSLCSFSPDCFCDTQIKAHWMLCVFRMRCVLLCFLLPSGRVCRGYAIGLYASRLLKTDLLIGTSAMRQF